MYKAEIDLAIDSLRAPGGVIVVPTDTTYGVVSCLQDRQAIERIYELKGRDRSKPLIILGAQGNDLAAWFTGHEEIFWRLAQRFWPGPLTIVVTASSAVPAEILSGGKTVGLRIPDHEATRTLIDNLPDKCVASTSANLSGAGFPKDFQEVSSNVGHLVDYVLPDCGQAPNGSESTIIDITKSPPAILRAGAIDPQEILSFLEAG